MVRQAAQRVPQLPHAERVAEEGVPAPHDRPELRQGEGEFEHRRGKMTCLFQQVKERVGNSVWTHLLSYL